MDRAPVEETVSGPAPIAPDATPRLTRGVRIAENEAHGVVLLAPERIFKMDAVGKDILQRCTGKTTFSALIDELAARYATPRERVLHDVTALLRMLAEKRLVEL